jgi:hypothetical protein
MLGMLAFVAGAELLLFLVQLVDVRFFHGYLELHTVASPNTPILGGISWFLLILMVLTLGLWLVLNKFGIIQPLSPRVRAATTSATRGRTGQATAATAGRNRAARRQAATTAGNAASKSASTSSSRRAVAGEHDEAYHRVKAAQRSRKRRAAKH